MSNFGVKGISPLIATVLLIAFTMAIAGIMATWATSFVQAKITETENQTSVTCAGMLSIDARIIDGKGYAVVTVETTTQTLSSFRGYLFYSDPSKNEALSLNQSINLSSGEIHTFNFTNSSANPLYISITAGNCPSATRKVSIIK